MKSCALVCCSDGRKAEERETISLLKSALSGAGLICNEYGSLFRRDGCCCPASPQERAAALNKAFADNNNYIFDISGGNIANELLPYIDFDAIASSRSELWGYSDLTSILNAVYALTGRQTVLYQIKNIVGECSEIQTERFSSFLAGKGEDLFSPEIKPFYGQPVGGTVIGGNLRCFLKLAGTPYFPETEDRLLLLESLSADEAALRAGLAQLHQMGVFGKIRGIILGSFSRLTKEGRKDLAAEIVCDLTDGRIPVMQTDDIGHAPSSKAIRLGFHLRSEQKPRGTDLQV